MFLSDDCPWLPDVLYLTNHGFKSVFVSDFFIFQGIYGPSFPSWSEVSVPFISLTLALRISTLLTNHLAGNCYLFASFDYHLYRNDSYICIFTSHLSSEFQKHSSTFKSSGLHKSFTDKSNLACGKINSCSPHHLLDLLNFLSQQMASSSITHVRNLEVNRDYAPSLNSHSITKSC